MALSLADLADLPSLHERRRKDAELEMRHGQIELNAKIESYKLRQNDAHHVDDLSQRQQHHEDNMRAIARSDQLDAQKLNLLAERDRKADSIARARLNFDRESAELAAQNTREAALIHARAAIEVAHIQRQGDLEVADLKHQQSTELAHQTHTQTTELAEINNRHEIALSELEHTQDISLAREQSNLANFDATTAILRESALSGIRRGEDASKSFNAALGAILVEKVRGRIASELEDKKEKHRSNERAHELTLAEQNIRLSRIGFTKADLIRYGYTESDADEILSRLIAAINGTPTGSDLRQMASDCLDAWEQEKRENPIGR